MVVALRVDEQLSRNSPYIIMRMFAAKEGQLHDAIPRIDAWLKMVLTLRGAIYDFCRDVNKTQLRLIGPKILSKSFNLARLLG